METTIRLDSLNIEDNKMLEIINDGPEIKSTNYFSSPHAAKGLIYLSWNASAARILVPENRIAEIAEMKTGKIVVISRGNWLGRDALEIMFDDQSDSPYSMHIEMGQTDRAIINDHKPFIVTAWTKNGKVAEWKHARYREVQNLPFLAPWIEH